MKITKPIILILACINSLSAVGDNQDSVQHNADKHPVVHHGTLTNPYESLVTGNGDIALSAQVFSHELVLKIGKGDIWDSRVSVKTEDEVLTHDRLIKTNGDDSLLDEPIVYQSMDYVCSSKRGATPKPAGFIKIRHPGLSNTNTTSRVDISSGILTVNYEFPEGRLIIEAFPHKNKNRILVKLSARGKIPWLSIIMEKPPDYATPEMPDPFITKGKDNHKWAISQTIPGRFGVDDFSWHLAGVFPENLPSNVWCGDIIKWNYALEQDLKLDDGSGVTFAAAITTDREKWEDPLEKAFRLAGKADPENYTKQKAIHTKAWQSFWNASSITLEDKGLEAQWYRGLFGFESHLKPGAQAPGLNANIPVYDYTSWNGAYTWNHNVQKWYFPALPVNHPEWYEVFADLVEQHMPVFEYLSQLIFDLDGAYVGLMTFPYTPPERTMTHPVFGRALAHTGWISSMLFEHFEFTRDTSWLEENAYPFIKKAAEFYSNYIEKYQGEEMVIEPSMLLEDTRNWEPGFRKSKNVATDLVMFKKGFKVAARSAQILDADEEKAEKWRTCIKRIPKVEYGWKDGQGWYAIYKNWDKIWPDFEEYLHHLRTSRWGCSGWLIFPGQHINGDEKEGLAKAVRDVIKDTDLLNLPESTRQLGTFHGEANFLPFIRAGLMDKFDELRTLILNHRFESGQFSPYSYGENRYISQPPIASWRIMENQYFPILGITEMLLQSQGNIIRLFPFWPEQKTASFNNLMARGSFLISAEKNSENELKAEIRSLKGNDCKIQWDRDKKPTITQNNKPIEYSIKGRNIIFKTKPNMTYILKTN